MCSQLQFDRKHVQDIATKGSSKASLKRWGKTLRFDNKGSQGIVFFNRNQGIDCRNYRGAFHLAMFNFHGVSHGSYSTAISDGAAQPCI